MKYLPWLLFGLTALVLVGFVSFYVGSRQINSQVQEKTQSTNADSTYEITQSTPEVTGETVWQTYTSDGPKFSFQYPKDLILEKRESEIILTKQGPSQKEGTEFYDGISLSFKTGTLDSFLEEFVKSRHSQMVELFETQDFVPVNLGELSGFTFYVAGYARGQYYFLDLNSDSYLEIFDATLDPGDLDFAKIVAQIFKTLK